MSMTTSSDATSSGTTSSQAAQKEYEQVMLAAAQEFEVGTNGQCQMSFPVEWIMDDLPPETKAGNSLDKEVQKLLNQSFHVPATYEHLVKSKAEVPDLPPVEEPKKLTLLVFADQGGIMKDIIDSAPEGRIGNRKYVENTHDLDIEEMKELIGKKGTWDVIIFAAGMDTPVDSSVTEVIEMNRAISMSFYHFCKACVRQDPKRVAVVTRGVFDESPKVHKKHGLKVPVAGNLFGHCNTSRQEMEDTDIQYIDMDYIAKDPDVIYPKVISEILRLNTFGHNSVRITAEGRYVLRQMMSKKYEVANHEWKMPAPGQFIGITGGNGALALVMGEWLLGQAEKLGATGFSILFLSRSMKISDENMPTWKRIQSKAEKLGIHVEQAKCDVGSQAGVDAFIQSVTPNLFGLIHSAGVLRDTMLINLTAQQNEEVYDSKHRPALYIHGALERFNNPHLQFYWMFSSVAVYGSMGQWNYSGSNAFLDGIARHRIARGKPAMAVQWGAWGDVGMAAIMDQALRNRIAQGPQPYFSNAEGLSGLEAGLKTGLPYFSVFKWNPSMMFAMIQGSDNTDANFFRNFHSEIFPVNMPPTLDRQHHGTLVNFVRKEAGGRAHRVFDAYVQPKVEADKKEWGDDFRNW